MPRPRKIRTQYHIPYVHDSYGRIVYRPYYPLDKREGLETDKNGFLKKPIVLGNRGDDPDDIYRAYVSARESLRLQQASARNTLGWIIDQYFQSRQYRSLATNSQRRAQNLAAILQHPLKINGAQSTLAALHVRQLSQPLLHQIADKRLDQYQNRGLKGVVQVNRETTFLSTAISWACNYIPDIGISTNPLRGYKKYKEEADERYVTDEEYQLEYDLLPEIRPYLQPLFELTYLLATRGAETLDIKLSDCTEAGIRTHRLKNSRDNTIEWSQRLRAAYEAALALHHKHKQTLKDPFLICQPNR